MIIIIHNILQITRSKSDQLPNIKRNSSFYCKVEMLRISRKDTGKILNNIMNILSQRLWLVECMKSPAKAIDPSQIAEQPGNPKNSTATKIKIMKNDLCLPVHKLFIKKVKKCSLSGMCSNVSRRCEKMLGIGNILLWRFLMVNGVANCPYVFSS